jgi:hypothetical protein
VLTAIADELVDAQARYNEACRLAAKVERTGSARNAAAPVERHNR